MPLALAIFVRIVANPLSNVFQKLLTTEGRSPAVVILATHALLSVVCVPLLVVLPGPRSSQFWFDISLCAALAVAANTLLVAAVKLADLSVLGPINSYKAVVSLVPGIVLLGELPGPAALVGIVLIVCGSYGLSGPSAKASRAAGDRARPWFSLGVRYRIAALVLSAVEAVFLKRALFAAEPTTTFAWWAVLGLAAAIPPARLLRSPRSSDATSTPITGRTIALGLALAVTTGLMQYSTLVTFGRLQVAGALALFQTSSLVSVVLGHRVFREPHVWRRLAAGGVMVVGAALIIFAGA